MNGKQLIIVAGLAAYIIGGLIAAILNLESFIEVLRSQQHLLMPIYSTFGRLVILGLAMIYLLRDKKQ